MPGVHDLARRPAQAALWSVLIGALKGGAMSGGLKDRRRRPRASALFQDVDHRAGHRQRLKDRFVNAGPEALPDYELLELVRSTRHPPP